MRSTVSAKVFIYPTFNQVMKKAQANWQVISLVLAIIFLLIFIGFAIALKGGSVGLVDKIGDSLSNIF